MRKNPLPVLIFINNKMGNCQSDSKEAVHPLGFNSDGTLNSPGALSRKLSLLIKLVSRRCQLNNGVD